MRERNALDDQLKAIGRIEQELDDQLTLIELGEAEKDEAIVAEAEAALKKLKTEVARRELEALLSGEADANDCYLEVHAGAGGTESQDWADDAAAHVRALGRAARLQGRVCWKRAKAKRPASSRRPCRSRATTPMAGSRRETGVHRLVRISPFDSNARRHTSFASVGVYPVIDDRIKIDIKENDVRTDTMRSRRRRRPARQQDRSPRCA